ncbi:hypothetical protein J2P12_04715, partial [Candidatus Bathyarchaeota archaeon]|nr:hypothetical protein [Candidatus Bathyarchaeota archaeon]
YLFSDETTRQTVTQYRTNTTIVVPTTAMQWNTVTLDPEPVWFAQGWTIPAQVTISFFLESELQGVYYASITDITPT